MSPESRDEPGPSLRERVTVIQGDITQMAVAAVVNAANQSLLGGGGVDGAIHRGAGPELLAECRSLRGCKTGQAKLTAAYRLPARQVIHTVGPIWRGGQHGEAALLADCYNNSLELALEHELEAIAFPSISTGAFGFPLSQAAQIAVETVKNWLESHAMPQKVIHVCFSSGDCLVYQKAVDQAYPNG